MTLILLGAVLADRPALTMRNLAFAALAVVVTEPEALLGGEFQLVLRGGGGAGRGLRSARKIAKCGRPGRRDRSRAGGRRAPPSKSRT